MNQDNAIDTELLARYAEGELGPLASAELAPLLEKDGTTKRRYDELKEMMHHIGSLDVDAKDIDFVPLVREAITAAPARRSARRIGRFVASLAACLAAGLIAWFFWPASRPAKKVDSSAFNIKGDQEEPSTRQKWTEINAYATDGKSLPRRLGSRVRAEESLLFAYTNNGPKPYGFLMIFAVDAQHTVYWYYPAYLTADSDPASIPIDKGSKVELKELIHHDVASGPLYLVALFTDEVKRVSRVEKMISDLTKAPSFDWKTAPSFPFEQHAVHVIQTEVTP